jgi:hypothetical protein
MFWLTRVNEHYGGGIAFATAPVLAISFGGTHVIIATLPPWANISVTLVVFIFAALMVVVYRNISQHGLLPKLIEFCQDGITPPPSLSTFSNLSLHLSPLLSALPPLSPHA